MAGDHDGREERKSREKQQAESGFTRRGLFRRTGALALLPVFAGAVSETAAAARGTISNDSVEALVETNGTFELRTADGAQLTFPSPSTSGLTVRVDGTNYKFGTPAGEFMDQYLTQETTFSDDGTSATTKWELPESVAITQTLSLAEEAIEFELSAVNNDSSAHDVKFRYFHDYQVADQDGAPIFVNGEVLTTETRFTSPSFDSWQTYDRLPDPNLTGQGTQGTVPDKIEFVHWPTANTTGYEYNEFDPERQFYTPGETNSPASDSAGLLYFELGTLDSGDSDRITTYYGVGDPTETSVENLAQGLSGFQNAVSSLLTTAVEARAQAHAQNYHNVGESYAENLVNYFGTVGDVSDVSSDSVDPNVREYLTTLTEGVPQPSARALYEFFDEMFGAASLEDSVEDTAQTFTEYLWGTASEQTHTLEVNGQTLSELKDGFETDFESRRSQAVDAVRDADPSVAQLEQLIQIIDQKRSRVRTREDELDRKLTELAGTVGDEGKLRVLGGQTRGTTESSEFGTQSAFEGSILSVGIIGAAPLVSGVNTTTVFDGRADVDSVASIDGVYSGSATEVSLAWTQYSAMFWTTVATWGSTGPSAQHVIEGMVVDKALEGAGLSMSDLVESFTGIEIELVTGLGNIPVTLVESMLAELSSDGVSSFLTAHTSAVTITDLSASEITESDIGEEVAEATGTVSIENQSNQPVTPTLDRTRSGITTAGVNTVRQIPDVGAYLKPESEMPTIPAGESRDVSVRYGIPVQNGQPRNVGRYDLAVAVTNAYRTEGDFEISSFDVADDRDPEANVEDVQQGQINAGNSDRTTTSVAPDQDRVSFDMSYAGSDLDLHLYDQQDNHVGRNYDTGEFENEIPGARASGPDQSGEAYEEIQVNDPGESYDVEVVGLETDAGGTEFGTRSNEFDTIDSIIGLSPQELITGPAGDPLRLTVSEEGGDDGLTNVTFDTVDLTADGADEVIPAENISFDTEGFDVAAGADQTVGVTVEVPEAVPIGRYTGEVTVQSANNTETLPVSVERGVIGRSLPQDLDGDNRTEDIDGDGEFTLADVHLFFEEIYGRVDSTFVQENVDSFDFDNDGEITLGDVRELYNLYLQQNPGSAQVLDLEGGPTLRPSPRELE